MKLLSLCSGSRAEMHHYFKVQTWSRLQIVNVPLNTRRAVIFILYSVKRYIVVSNTILVVRCCSCDHRERKIKEVVGRADRCWWEVCLEGPEAGQAEREGAVSWEDKQSVNYLYFKKNWFWHRLLLFYHCLETPRLLDLVFGTETDKELSVGGAGASLFSKGFNEVLEAEKDLLFFLLFGVQTIPLMTTPFTISSRVIVSFSTESLWRSTPFLSSSSLPPGLVVILLLEAEGAKGNGPEPEISEDDGTFTQRLRRQV